MTRGVLFSAGVRTFALSFFLGEFFSPHQSGSGYGRVMRLPFWAATLMFSLDGVAGSSVSGAIPCWYVPGKTAKTTAIGSEERE